MSGLCDKCHRLKHRSCGQAMDNLKTCDMYERESNYEKLFGTPERTVRTLEKLHVDLSDWCGVFDDCHDCMFGQVDGKRITCWEPEDFSLVEWLKGGDTE